jgi:hypothetical protein
MGRARSAGRWRALTAAGALVLAGLGGCDDDSAAPAPLDPSPTSASTAEPSGTPTPTLPAEAEGTSIQSAKTFAQYFISAVNFAIRTGDADPVMSVSAPGCVTCKAVKRNAERIYGAGGKIEGGQMDLNTVTVVTPPPKPALLLGVSYSPERVIEPGKNVVRRRATKGSLSMFLRPKDDSWVVERLVVVN